MTALSEGLLISKKQAVTKGAVLVDRRSTFGQETRGRLRGGRHTPKSVRLAKVNLAVQGVEDAAADRAGLTDSAWAVVDFKNHLCAAQFMPLCVAFSKELA